MQEPSTTTIAGARTQWTDFIIQNEGNIFLVMPTNERAARQIEDNVSDEAQWFGPSLVVDHRYIESLVQGLRSDGFTVS